MTSSADYFSDELTRAIGALQVTFLRQTPIIYSAEMDGMSLGIIVSQNDGGFYILSEIMDLPGSISPATILEALKLNFELQKFGIALSYMAEDEVILLTSTNDVRCVENLDNLVDEFINHCNSVREVLKNCRLLEYELLLKSSDSI